MRTTCKLTREERIGILTDAIECASIEYWTFEETGKLIKIWRRKEDTFITKALITYLDSDNQEIEAVITPATIQKGIDAILKPGFEIREDIKNSILEGDTDQESCDCIIQAALFGELIYG